MNHGTLSTNITVFAGGEDPFSQFNLTLSNATSGCVNNSNTPMSSFDNVFPVISFIILGIGIFGNLLALLAFLLRWKQLSISDFFLVNLAVVDVMGCVVSPANLIYSSENAHRYSLVGQPNCQLILFLIMACISVSALSLIASAVHRYNIIRSPLRPQMPKKYLIPIITVIWLLGSLPGIPYLTNTEKTNIANGLSCVGGSESKFCKLISSKDRSLIPAFIIWVIIPQFLVLSIFFGIVYEFNKMLNRDSATMITQPKQRKVSVIAKNQQKNLQETKLLVILITLFLVCLLPFNCFYFYQLLQQTGSPPSDNILLAFKVLLLLQAFSSFLHPFVYAFCYAPFQKMTVNLFTSPYKCLVRIFVTLQDNKKQRYLSKGSELYLSQGLRDGEAGNSRKSSRVSYEGRKFSTIVSDGRKYSRAPTID